MRNREPGNAIGMDQTSARNSFAIESLETRMCLSAGGLQHDHGAIESNQSFHHEEYREEYRQQFRAAEYADAHSQAAPTNFSAMSLAKDDASSTAARIVEHTEVTFVAIQPNGVIATGVIFTDTASGQVVPAGSVAADGSSLGGSYSKFGGQQVRLDRGSRWNDGDRFNDGSYDHWNHHVGYLITSPGGITRPVTIDPSIAPPPIADPASPVNSPINSPVDSDSAAPVVTPSGSVTAQPVGAKSLVARGNGELRHDSTITATQALAATNVKVTLNSQTSRVAEWLQTADHTAGSFVSSSISRFASLSGAKLAAIWSAVTNLGVGGGGGIETGIAQAEAAVASAADNVVGAVEGVLAQTAASVATTPQRVYEFAHLGSPFTLLADSVASFVEDSATIPTVASQARSQGPWVLTFGVLAADVVVLTYMHRKGVKLRRRSGHTRQPAM